MTDIETITLEAELTDEAAEREIETAVRGRHSVARQYVRWVRRGNPEATPAEVIKMLERRYIVAVAVAGGLMTAGSIALELGIALIPGGGVVASAAKSDASKSAMKQVAKAAALGAARLGGQRVANMLPAGDAQLQFELTALYALALADIHGMNLDQARTHALVHGLSNDGVSQGQIAAMAADLARSSSSPVDVGKSIATGRQDWSHWAHTLADSLPAGAAQELVRGVQTGRLEDVRTGMGTKQQAAVEYGAGALVGGVTRFVFGRKVVDAARQAFADAPAQFPSHLAIEIKEKPEKNDEPNRALLALQNAVRSTGSWVGDSAHTIGSGVQSAADTVTRPFRSVDHDGDGIPDAPPALTAVKGVGGAIAGAATTVAGKVTAPFTRKKSEDPTPNADADAAPIHDL